MIKRRWIGWVAVLLMVATVFVTVFAYLFPSSFGFLTGAAKPAYVSGMDKTKVIDIQIIADEKDWADMLENANAKEYIPATVIINGTKIENVAIRPKGNSSLTLVAASKNTDRFSFKIEFDHYITGQTWMGLDKLAINNMMDDATYMKEYISYDIMSYIGVDAPLYAFTNISVNGEAWGFYLAVEVPEDSYAQRVYGNDHGKLYKPEGSGMFGGGMASGGGSLQYTDDSISSYSGIFDNSVFDATDLDYERVIKALKKLSNSEDLKNAVDIEAVLKFFAAHTVVVSTDSYISSMAHNYYLYEENGQLTMLPWDYNMAFGGFQSSSAAEVVNFPIDTPVSGVSLDKRPLIGKLLEVPEYKDMYHEYLRQIVDGYFHSGLFEQTVDSLNTTISSYVENDPTAFYDYEAYQAAIVEFKKIGLLRAESVAGQLDGVIPSTSKGQSNDSSTLVDTSDVDFAALGKMGDMMGGMGGAAGLFAKRPADQGGNAVQGTGFGNRLLVIFSGFDTNTWLLVGGCFVLLLIGLSFVVFFKRRRSW